MVESRRKDLFGFPIAALQSDIGREFLCGGILDVTVARGYLDLLECASVGQNRCCGGLVWCCNAPAQNAEPLAVASKESLQVCKAGGVVVQRCAGSDDPELI